MKMKTALLLLLGTLAAAGAIQAQGGPCQPVADDQQPGADNGSGDPAVASAAYFHEQLSPYGHWVTRDGYGDVWVPDVAPGWRPYTTGHWAYTDQGWAWVADESWGWAPFHYGRWFYDNSGGWGWVPGNVWAPAWVAWRSGGGYIGWAALPPAVGFTVGVGMNYGGVDLNLVGSPGYFSFVQERSILSPRLGGVIVGSDRNALIIKNTQNITNYTVVNNRVINNGVNVRHIEEVTGHPVQRVNMAHQAGLYQPPVMARAARVARTESFVNRVPGRAVGAAVVAGAAAGAVAGHAIATRQTAHAAGAAEPARAGAAHSTVAAGSHTNAGNAAQASQASAGLHARSNLHSAANGTAGTASAHTGGATTHHTRTPAGGAQGAGPKQTGDGEAPARATGHTATAGTTGAGHAPPTGEGTAGSGHAQGGSGSGQHARPSGGSGAPGGHAQTQSSSAPPKHEHSGPPGR